MKEEEQEEKEEEVVVQEEAGSMGRKMHRLLHFAGAGGAQRVLEGGIIDHYFQLQQRWRMGRRGQLDVERNVCCKSGAGYDLQVLGV